MPGIGTDGAPFAAGAAARPAFDMQHRALVAHQQTQQLDESGAIESAGGAIGSGLNSDRIAHARDRQSLLATQLGAEHGVGCAARGAVTEQPRGGSRDRKSTRLNSSHPSISYAVFCLKQ